MNLQPAIGDAGSVTIKCVGGRNAVYAAGTWGSGTLTGTWSPTITGTFVPIGSGFAITSNVLKGVELPEGYLKLTMAGSTGASVVVGVDVSRSASGI